MYLKLNYKADNDINMMSVGSLPCTHMWSCRRKRRGGKTELEESKFRAAATLLQPITAAATDGERTEGRLHGFSGEESE